MFYKWRRKVDISVTQKNAIQRVDACDLNLSIQYLNQNLAS